MDGPLLILAGPGSGKTRVVTHRIAYLLEQGIASSQILALTFTNKAAEEMAARVRRLVEGEEVWTSTFHRFCAKLLRRYAPLVGLEPNYTIYDTDDSLRALKRALARVELDSSLYSPEQIAAAISRAKSNLVTAGEYGPGPGTPIGRVVAQIYPAYQAELLSANAVDFDDLLLHVAVLLREQPDIRQLLDERFGYLLVDEYQDTNLAQYAIVRALSIDQPNLSVTGDPDQSIYGWRGANVGNILQFERDYPGARVVRLERNYRSTQRILAVADALICHNRRRKAKALYTENEPGRPVQLAVLGTQKDEADHIASLVAGEIKSGRRRARDFAVFYRVNALSRALESALRNHGVPYQMVNGLEFYRRKEIKDILAYLHLLNNPRDNMAFLRIINTPPRGIGKTTIQRISQHAAQRGLTLLEAARESGMIDALPKRSAVAVARFVALFDRLSLIMDRPLEEVLGHVLSESRYQKRLAESDDPEDQERLENIEELLTAAREFDEQNDEGGGLEAFLEEASLVNETDAWEVDDDRLTLMTLHASKGLEFQVVFIIALEERLLPHERSTEHPDDLEEERRLLFVGITRAQQELYLSRVKQREFRGQRRMAIPSSFLFELPAEEMQLLEQPDSQVHWEPIPEDETIVSAASRDARPAAAALASGIALTTADQLLAGNGPRARPSEGDQFHQGMAVRHPEHGEGRIVALGGSGVLRSATVEFAESIGRKRFILAHCPLRPL